MARSKANVTTDHDEIRRWAEERDAKPACVRRTGGDGDIGMIRLDFPGYSGDQSLEHISWDEWFQKFDESNLALLHQDTLATGGKSNFNKLIARETAQARQQGHHRASRRKLESGTARKARSRSASAKSSASTRAKKSASTSARSASARTKSASRSRTKSSAASSRSREPGRTISRSKSTRGSRGAKADVTRRSGTNAARTRGRTATGSRQPTARNTGRRSAKGNPEKVVKSARGIKQGAENIIRLERGQGSRRPARVTRRTSAKSATGTAKQGRSRSTAHSRKKAA